MIHWCWIPNTFLTSSFFPLCLSPCHSPLHRLYLFCVTHSPPSLLITSLHPSFLSLSLPSICNSFFSPLDRMLCCIIKPPLNRRLFFPPLGSWFIQKQVVPREDRSGTGSWGGKDEREREREKERKSFVLWCEHQGEGRLCQIIQSVFAWEAVYSWHLNLVNLRLLSKFLHVIMSRETVRPSSPLSLHLTSPTTNRHALTHMVVLSILWTWHSSAGRECRGGQRETERRRAKNQ